MTQIIIIAVLFFLTVFIFKREEFAKDAAAAFLKDSNDYGFDPAQRHDSLLRARKYERAHSYWESLCVILASATVAFTILSMVQLIVDIATR